MTQPERTRVSAWTRLQSFAVGKYKAVQLSIERRSFERKLERIVRAADAHHSCGQLPGASQFKLLRKCADDLCANLAQRWDISPELLEAQIPAITKLKALADPPSKPRPTVLVTLGVAGAVALFFLMGVLAGLASVGYHLIGGR
ncbi:MAG TPA: hypothetical protein VJY15_23050 [Candidatus Acidoferrum sp.]|nr:hypothetical protein [Candidatus Acidoferrum sp.]